MAINVKNERVEEQLRELCRLTGESLTEAIGRAVAQRLASLGNRTSSMGLKDALLSLGRECAKLPDLDRRSHDEILGYTAEGTFRMIIDSSAILAILLAEPDAGRYAEAISKAERRLISSFSCLECSAVLLSRKGPAALQTLQAFLFRARIQEVAFSPEQNLIAIEACRRLGKGRHPAGLNLGDCCSYASAKALDLPLLYKGEDFSKTDVAGALPAA